MSPALLVLCAAVLCSVSAFVHTGLRKSYIRQCDLSMALELDTGDFDCNLEQTDYQSTKASNLYEFTLKAKIPAKEMNVYLDEYKEEMKKRKVVFPGFRPGKLPPYIMGDVRKYIVSYGLESMLGGLANLNDMQLVTEEGEDVPFGEDAYYEEIILKDDNGRGFEQIRDSWKENCDFAFSAKFFAIKDEEEEEGTEDGEEESSGPADAIDAEIVEE